jgi:hypothetical protein
MKIGVVSAIGCGNLAGDTLSEPRAGLCAHGRLIHSPSRVGV